MFGISVFLCLCKAEGIMDWCAEAAAEQASAGAKCLSEVVGIERIEPVSPPHEPFAINVLLSSSLSLQSCSVQDASH